jgi:hypothetical protein
MVNTHRHTLCCSRLGISGDVHVAYHTDVDIPFVSSLLCLAVPSLYTALTWMSARQVEETAMGEDDQQHGQQQNESESLGDKSGGRIHVITLDDEEINQRIEEHKKKWGNDLDGERKQLLWAVLRNSWNSAVDKKALQPFSGKLLSGTDVFWLAVCALAGPDGFDGNVDEAEQYLRKRRYEEDEKEATDPFELPRLWLGGALLIHSSLARRRLSSGRPSRRNRHKSSKPSGSRFERRADERLLNLNDRYVPCANDWSTS